MTETQRITDLQVLKALAQPIRQKLYRLLAQLGPSTVGTLAKKIDGDPGQVSYHLRELAKRGLIDEAPELAKDKRERVYRRRPDLSTSWSEADFSTPDGKVIVDTIKSQMITDEFERTATWERDRNDGQWSEEWNRAATTSQSIFLMTPEELKQFETEIQAILRRWGKRGAAARDSGDTEGRELVFHFTHSFPERP